MKEFFQSYGVPPLDNAITDFLERNKLELPIEYLMFLKEVNGGIPLYQSFELGKFDLQEKNTNCYVDIEEFFSVESLQSVWDNVHIELDEHRLFPIAEVLGGMLLCCNQNNSNDAQLYFFDYDFDVVELNLSLTAFLKNLIPESDVDYKKYGIDF